MNFGSFKLQADLAGAIMGDFGELYGHFQKLLAFSGISGAQQTSGPAS
jgi:hypothetical protein